jgi:hypothetical protein
MTKVRENHLRRVAARRGLKLIKSARRDPQALDYGLYALIDLKTDKALLHGGTTQVNPAFFQLSKGRVACTWTLEQVEAYFDQKVLDELGQHFTRALNSLRTNPVLGPKKPNK